MTGREKLEQLRAKHKPNRRRADGHTFCRSCKQEWTCNTSRLIALADEALEGIAYAYAALEGDRTDEAMLHLGAREARALSKLEERE